MGNCCITRRSCSSYQISTVCPREFLITLNRQMLRIIPSWGNPDHVTVKSLSGQSRANFGQVTDGLKAVPFKEPD